MGQREPLLMVVVGKKGVGKTYTTEKDLRSYVMGNSSAGIKPRRVLILDVNDEFQNVKSISIEHISAFSRSPYIEIRRIRPYKKDGKRMSLNDVAEVLGIILDNFAGGCLLVEDINKYIADTMPMDLIGSICTNRHADLDIILHYQSIARLVPKVWQNLNGIRFHKQSESVEKHVKKFPDKFEILTIAENLVNSAYETDPRFYCYVNTDSEKILGNITQGMKIAAIDKFIMDNPKSTTRIVMNTYDPDSKGAIKRISLQEAHKTCRKNLLEKYF